MHKLRSVSANLAAIFLILAALACNFPGYPQPPATATSMPPGQVTPNSITFEQVFIQAVQQATPDGKFNATVTQEQFTDWLAVRAPQYAQSQNQEWPFKNSQATFKDGKVVLYSVLAQKGAPESPVQLELTPAVDANGQFTFRVTSGRMGILPVPDALLGRVTEIIQDAANGQLNQIKGKYKLFTLAVGSGTLTVAGQLIR